MLHGLTIFFAVTTTAVIAYPLIKLLPSWRERAAYRRAKPPETVLRTPSDTDIDAAA